MSTSKSRPGRRSVPPEDAKEINARLREFIDDRFSRAEFEVRSGIPHTTVTGWFGKRFRVPDASHLLKMARKLNLNLNWLLLGEGDQEGHDGPEPELRAMKLTKSQLEDEVRTYLAAELETLEGGPTDDIETLLPPTQEILPDLVAEHQSALKDWRQKMGKWRKDLARTARLREPIERARRDRPDSIFAIALGVLGEVGPRPTPRRRLASYARSRE